MKQKVVIISLLACLVFGLQLRSDARSGCCSHHGGVCGWACCDGTRLSVICGGTRPKSKSNQWETIGVLGVIVAGLYAGSRGRK